MHRIPRFVCLAPFFLFLTLAGGPFAFGQADAESYSGWHVSGLGFQSAFAGHFDGDHFFESGGAFYLVPKMKTSLGWGGGIGVRRGDMDVEFVYGQSTHDYTYSLLDPGKARFSRLGINYRFFLITRGIIQPFVGTEIALTWLKVENGSFMEDPPYRTADNTFSGLTLGGVGGLAIYPTPMIGFFGAAVLSWKTFGNMKGVGGERLKLDKLDSVSLDLRFGVTIRFLRTND